jgi:hypothetical protein
MVSPWGNRAGGRGCDSPRQPFGIIFQNGCRERRTACLGAQAASAMTLCTSLAVRRASMPITWRVRLRARGRLRRLIAYA